MKTKYSILALATLLLGALGACTDDDLDGTGSGGNKTPNVESGKVAFGFALKDFAKGSVPLSRADGDKLPASVAESSIDSLSIYVFNQSDTEPYDSTKTLFTEEFKIKGDELATVGTAKTATIQLSGLGKKKIYFVANGLGHRSLDQMKLNETTEAQFLLLKTNALQQTEQIYCPLVMTAVDSIEVLEKGAAITTAGYQTNIETAITGRTIEMKRILARFDIENNAETSDLVIESIALNNVHPSAYISKNLNFRATKHSEYTYTDDAALPEMDKFDFTRYPNANAGRAQSVFYVYPDLNSGAGAVSDDGEVADRFYLTLYGKTKKTGASVVYNIYMYKDNADQTQNPIIVKPNNQYLIKINDLDPTKLKATITVQDWLIGDTISYEMSLGTVALSCVEFPLTEVETGGSGQMLTIPATRGGAAATPVNVKVEAISEWELVKGYNAAWIDTTTNIDPAALPVGTQATVLPQTANPYAKERRGTLVFRNVQRPSIMQTLVVTQKAPATAPAVPVAIGKLSAADGAYIVVNRPTDGTTDEVGITEKADTLMLATPALLANTAYTGIKINVDSCGNTAESIQQEWAIRVDAIDSTWIHIKEQPGLNQHGKHFTFDLLANDTTLSRTGTIRLYDRQDATIYRDLVIVQSGKASEATIEAAETGRLDFTFTDLTKGDGTADGIDYNYTLGFPKEKTTAAPYRIKLTTNAAWSIADVGNTPYYNWLKAYALDGTNKRVMSGVGNAMIEIGTTLNDSANVRTGFVTLNIAGLDTVIRITQAASDPSIVIDDRHIIGNHIDFPSAAPGNGVATIFEDLQFITNDEWTITAVKNGTGGTPTADPADWLTFQDSKDATVPPADITSGSGSMVLRITAAEQAETTGGAGADARSATVTIECKNTPVGGGDKPKIVLTIYQAGIEATPVP